MLVFGNPFSGTNNRGPRDGYYGEGRECAGSQYGGFDHVYSAGYGTSARYGKVRPSSSRRHEDAGSRYESLRDFQPAGLSRSRTGLPSRAAADRASRRNRDRFIDSHIIGGPSLSRTDHYGLDDGAKSRAAERYVESSDIARGYSRCGTESSRANDSGSSWGTCEARSYVRAGDGSYRDPFQASLEAERSRGFGLSMQYGGQDGGMDRLAREAHFGQKHDHGDRYRNYEAHGGGRGRY